MKDCLKGIVTTNILFSSYAQEEHAAIVDAFESKTVTAGTFVIRQGESGDNFYVVESGSLDIYVRNANGVEAKVGNPLTPGTYFGELALMYNTPRAASIKASTDCVVWFIDRDTYRSIVVYHKYLRNKQYMDFLRNVEIMNKKLGLVMTDGV
jgi:cAMP-dependent protein kinase regulator